MIWHSSSTFCPVPPPPQRLTVYTQFINGPKAPGQPSGPDEMHVVFLDNGRSDILASKYRDILRCIRCGACQNVCPVYRQASGHGYRAVYGGPIGAVLSPLLAGENFPDYADLPKASSLCGACREVCPVDIPIPDLLLRLRAKSKQEGLPSPGSPPMGPFATLATSPSLWRAAMTGSKVMNLIPPQLTPAASLAGVAPAPHPSSVSRRRIPAVDEAAKHHAMSSESDRHTIFEALSRARKTGDEPVPLPAFDEALCVAMGQLHTDDLWECFAENFGAVNGTCHALHR